MTETKTTPTTIKATVAEIMRHWFSKNPGHAFGFDGLREPEIAAWLGLDTELTYKAIARLERHGLARFERGGNGLMVGWYRTSSPEVA